MLYNRRHLLGSMEEVDRLRISNKFEVDFKMKRIGSLDLVGGDMKVS